MKKQKLPKLTTREEAFCLEIVRTDGSASSVTEAFRKVYRPKSTSVKYHRVKASKIFNREHIQKRITELRQGVIDQVKIEAADILKQWAAIIHADVTEIVRIERNCCRHCYGINYFYQWSEIEWIEHTDRLRAARGEVHTDSDQYDVPRGGFGFDPTQPPNRLCKVCFGKGVESLFIADSRNLSDNAKMLFLGAEIKKDGSIKVLLEDRKNARENLAKALGMYEEGWRPPGSGEIENINFTIETLDPQEAANTYQRIMKG